MGRDSEEAGTIGVSFLDSNGSSSSPYSVSLRLAPDFLLFQFPVQVNFPNRLLLSQRMKKRQKEKRGRWRCSKRKLVKAGGSVCGVFVLCFKNCCIGISLRVLSGCVLSSYRIDQRSLFVTLRLY